MPDHNDLTGDELRHKLNLETGRIRWQELQRHFARGMVLVVDKQADLIEVAASLSEDDTRQLESWLHDGQLWRARDEDAIHWQETGAVFRSVVVAPWVLVQATGQPRHEP